MKIYNLDTETEEGLTAYKHNLKTDSPIFLACEKIWWDWFNKEKDNNSEIEDMYFS